MSEDDVVTDDGEASYAPRPTQAGLASGVTALGGPAPLRGPVPQVVVMGVSAAGKSTVGRGIAEQLGVEFIDGDSLHPLANVKKMSDGIPLEDADRWPWLDEIGAVIAAHPSGVVLACSALKRAYRVRILGSAPKAVFVHLHGSDELLAQRAAGRAGHFMPPALLASQLATLEPLGADEPGVVVDVAPAPPQIVEAALSYLNPTGT